MDIEHHKGLRPLVLVVDDDDLVSAALERSLKRLGYDVLIAQDGVEGFEQALHAKPAVVLADVHMPGMDGHALLRRLAGSESQASVILMSGQGELDDAIGALREGAVDYLKKPWTPIEFTAALDRAMGLSSALRELSVPSTLALATARVRDAGSMESVDASALIRKLAGAATQESLKLPAVHPVVARLRALAADADDWVDGVSALIEEDPALSAPLLRIASGTQDKERHAGDVRAVVAAMGREALHATIEMLTLRNGFPIAVAPLRTLNDRIWRFSVARALAMKGIAEIAEIDGKIDRHQYYLAGLLLDVGASYLLSVISEAMQQVGGRVSDPAAMTAAVAAHHDHVGALVIQRWGFSSELATLIRNHHADPSPSPGTLWCAAALGGALAVRLAATGDPTGDRELKPELLARCAYTLGVGDTVLRRLTKSLTENAGRIWAACG